MEKTKNKIFNRISFVNKKNEKYIKDELNKILNLKRIKIKEIDVRKQMDMYEVKLHDETHHFPLCTRFVLDLMIQLQSIHPYIKLSFIHKEPTEVTQEIERLQNIIKKQNLKFLEKNNNEKLIEEQTLKIKKLKSQKRKKKGILLKERDKLESLILSRNLFNISNNGEQETLNENIERKRILENEYNWNYISIHIYWEIFINDLQGTSSTYEELVAKKEDYSGVHTLLKDINEINHKFIEEKISEILNRQYTSLIQINDEIDMTLCKDTFNNYFSEQNFQQFCNEIRQKYPFIEIFHICENLVTIRVWWKIYYQPCPIIEPHNKKNIVQKKNIF